MPVSIRLYRPVLLFVFCCLTWRSAGQGSCDGCDEKMEYFSEKAQKDSFLYYAEQKKHFARQDNDLAAWLETYVDIQYYFPSEHDVCLKYLDEALSEKWRDPTTTAEYEQVFYIHALRGYHLSQLSRVWASVQAYEAANALYERYHFPDFNAVNALYKPLGNHYTRLGDNEKALALGGEPETLAGIYGNIAIAYWNEGNMPAAEAHCRKGLALPAISKAKKALLQSILALVQLDTRRPALARQTALAALRLLPPPDDEQRLEERARIRRTAGLASARSGHYADARQLLEGALADARHAAGNLGNRDIGKIELAFSELYLLQNQPLKALQAANDALVAVLPGFHPEQVETNPDPAGFYEENTIFEALIAKAAAADSLYGQKGNLQWLLLALDCHDLAYAAETRLRAVFQYESSKLGLQSNSRQREEAAIQICLRLYERTGQKIYLEKGFDMAERSKSAVLLEALRDNLIRQQLRDNEQYKTLITLRQTAAWYRKQLILDPQNNRAGQWRSDLDELTGRIHTLKNSIPQLERLEAAAPAPFTNRADLPSGEETWVEYFVGQHFVEIFSGNGTAVSAWNRLPNDAALQQEVRQFQSWFASANAILNDPAGYLQAAWLLHRKLLPEALPQSARMLIIPDGFTYFIPFEALVTESPMGTTSLQNAPYLIKKRQIRYAWSLHALQEQNALHSQAPAFFLGVAPLFEHGERGLPPLPASGAEWTSMGHGNTVQLLGKQATAAGFLAVAGNYRILHLSTHAFAGTDSQSPPRIELYDQALLLPDIYAMALQCDLVVLSACETGIGAEQKGEGVMSLARAFAQAGAAGIVSSLWTVNDRTTSLIFNDFYRFVENGETTGAALRQAKLHYLENEDIPAMQQSPYFWAGLVAVGADRSIGPSGNCYFIPVMLMLGSIFVLTWLYVKRRQFRGFFGG